MLDYFKIQTAFAATASSDAPAQNTDKIQGLVDNFIGAIPYWITGFIVIIMAFVLARIVRGIVENKMTEAGIEEDHREVQIVTGRTVNAGIIILGITIGLKIAGIDLTSILAAAAFGVGFAMKDIITNFLAGIIILLQKQFTIGDWIKVKGTEGVIKEIQSRYTILKKFDGTKMVVPNSELFKNQVNNLTGNQIRRFQFELSIDLYSDLKEYIDLVYKSIDKVDSILKKPKPSIIVTQPGSFANILQIRCWVDAKGGILKPKSKLIRQIHKDCYKRGLSWPYPTSTIILDHDTNPNDAARKQSYIDQHKRQKNSAQSAKIANTQVESALKAVPEAVVLAPAVATVPIIQAPAVAPAPATPISTVAQPLADITAAKI